MKKILIVFLLLASLTAGCDAGHRSAIAQTDVDSSSIEKSGNGENEESESKINALGGVSLENGIKFYPTYDIDYITVNSELFDFWFDIPREWKVTDFTGDGTEFSILPDESSVEITICGILSDMSIEDFCKGLTDKGTINSFEFRDNWQGKQIKVTEEELYFVRDDGDSFIVLYINTVNTGAWKDANSDELDYLAKSIRTTRESHGKRVADQLSIDFDDLQLGKIKLGISYDELLDIVQQAPEADVPDDYDGVDARTLFFADNTQIYMIDGIVSSINVTSPDYPTPRGLKTGDTTERLIDLYGEPANKDSDEQWGYSIDGYELFTVIIENNIIVVIQVDVAM